MVRAIWLALALAASGASSTGAEETAATPAGHWLERSTPSNVVGRKNVSFTTIATDVEACYTPSAADFALELACRDGHTEIILHGGCVRSWEPSVLSWAYADADPAFGLRVFPRDDVLVLPQSLIAIPIIASLPGNDELVLSNSDGIVMRFPVGQGDVVVAALREACRWGE